LHIPEAISMGDRVIVLSHRPAVIKAIHKIDFANVDKSPLTCRNCPEFSGYFDTLWKELDVHV